ncbi:MAG: glycerol-3-phosphate dehydrogenase/oxidase [Pseudomonadota bacterium]
MSSKLRQTNIQKLQSEHFNVCVVGGGINGAVCAAALSAQGAKVALIDKGDFAGKTSSQSSNLAWGGIKYLENREFSLVWRLCRSRNHLVKHYPSTVRETRFVTSIHQGFRLPVFAIYAGTLLYWLMGRFRTRRPRFLSKKSLTKRDSHIRMDQVKGGVEYSDCYLHDNDARFTFGFVRSAMDHGAIAANYVSSTSAEFQKGRWCIQSTDNISDEAFAIRAGTLINACGPEVDTYNLMLRQKTHCEHVYSKGVHLMVNRVTKNDRILTFFASDGRLFFVIPMGPKTCIGTTDTRVAQPHAGVSDEDRRFILNNANEMLKLAEPLKECDIIAERCGVRPLVSNTGENETDWLSLSRSHHIEFDKKNRHISIFGGKLTDCLNIGEEILELSEKLGIELPSRGRQWFGEPGPEIREKFYHQAQMMKLDQMTNPQSCEPLSDRLWRRYGEAAFNMLEMIRQQPAMAECMIENTEYLRCEIEHTAGREMITKLDDFLRRRSKISLVVPNQTLRESRGLIDACAILFGEDAQIRHAEYFSPPVN